MIGASPEWTVVMVIAAVVLIPAMWLVCWVVDRVEDWRARRPRRWRPGAASGSAGPLRLSVGAGSRDVAAPTDPELAAGPGPRRASGPAATPPP